jgi:hypothetical protein
MCWEAVAAVAALAGTALAGYGAQQSSQAQKTAARGIEQQNLTTQKAQQKGFNERIAAQTEQGRQTFAATTQGIADRAQAQTAMRQTQQAALDQQGRVIAGENEQASKLRAAGDAQAAALLEQTSGQNLAQGQADAKARQDALLASQVSDSGIASPEATNPYGSDQGAYKKRMAQAATNIRDYGSKIAETASYAQPGADVGLAVAGNQQGIMPATVADKLLRGGSAARLLPGQIAYSGATGLGGSQDALIQSRTQGAIDAANLQGGNALGISNLGQADSTTLAKNRADQIKQNSEYDKSVGGVISGIGNLALYGSGYKWGDVFGLTPTTGQPTSLSAGATPGLVNASTFN